MTSRNKVLPRAEFGVVFLGKVCAQNRVELARAADPAGVTASSERSSCDRCQLT